MWPSLLYVNSLLSPNGGAAKQMLVGVASGYAQHLAKKALLPAAALEEKAAAMVAAHKLTLQKRQQVRSEVRLIPLQGWSLHSAQFWPHSWCPFCVLSACRWLSLSTVAGAQCRPAYVHAAF